MEFNYLKKTKIVLAIAMIIITLTYVATTFGGFLSYTEVDYKTDANGKPIRSEKIEHHIESSMLDYMWFPSVHKSTLKEELGDFFSSEYDEEYEYNVNDTAVGPVLLFLLGIVTAILAACSLFTKRKILWTVFASIWGLVGVYNIFSNPILKAAGKIDCLSGAGNLVLMQEILLAVGCVIALASLVIYVATDKKNKRDLLQSILKERV